MTFHLLLNLELSIYSAQLQLFVFTNIYFYGQLLSTSCAGKIRPRKIHVKTTEAVARLDLENI